MFKQGERYNTVLDVVKKSEDWAAYGFLLRQAPVNVEVQLAFLRDIFKVAVANHQDEPAQRFVSWLFQAINDSELLPYLENMYDKKYLPPVLSDLIQKVMCARAKKAIELWAEIPAYKEVKEPDSIGWPILRKVATLLNTKKAILTEIAKWWRETDNETEANQMFDFLISLKPNTEAERKIIYDVIREATDKGFSIKRLAWCIETSVIEHLEIVRILAIAWARNADFGTLRTTLRAGMAHTK